MSHGSMFLPAVVIISLFLPWTILCDKYILVSNVTTVDNGEKYCNAHYNTSLASIHSESDNTEAKRLCVSDCGNSTPCKKACSIGANDKQKERWSNKTGWVWNDESLFNYTNWKDGEPNDWHGPDRDGEDCSLIWSRDHSDGGTWNDCPCDGSGKYEQRFLCNAPPTTSPTSTPTNDPSINPTAFTNSPTTGPISNPTYDPTTDPTAVPTIYPTIVPTFNPTEAPTINPTNYSTVITSSNSKEKPIVSPISSRVLIIIILCAALIICCFMIIVMACQEIAENAKCFQKQQKIENKGVELTSISLDNKPETLGYVPPGSNAHLLPPAVTPNDDYNYPTNGFESGLLSEDDEYINMDEYGQEEDPLYSKPNGNTTNGAQSGNIMHFYYMDVVPDGEEDDYNDELYHEKQRWEMCLMHALNGLLQKQQFTVKRMNAICKELAPQKVINPHKSLLQTGNYDANVLMMALGQINIEVQWFDSRKKHEFDLCDEEFLQFLEPAKHTFVGFILNKPSKTAFMVKRRHWIAVKKINGEWYNLDSKLKQPEKYKNAQELNAYLVHSLGENGAELMICRKKKIENVQQKKVQMNVVLQW